MHALIQNDQITHAGQRVGAWSFRLEGHRRYNQLVSLAYDLAEQQLREGSASAMVITHLLKLRTTEEHFP